MIFLNNILSVSKYESKLLMRSWFFKVFATLSVLLISGVSISILEINQHAFSSIPSLVAYNLMLYFNVAQAIVSIFLASEYLKRDKQLDTSEVFYVRPLSNAEYLLGKMWGTIRVFLMLNLIVIAIAITISYVYLQNDFSPLSFLLYFFILNVPTLVYIIGLSTFLMLIIKNQALTFVVLLGYIGLTLFYIGDKCYYLFDYMGFNIPMLESTITGFADLQGLIVHRVLYLLLGLGLILCSISLFRRLPNSPRALYPWRAAATLFLLAALCCGAYHVGLFVIKEDFQQEMIALNNQHVHDPKMEIDSCRIEAVQKKETLAFKVDFVGSPVKEATEFTFTLNPGFHVTSATMSGQALTFKRKEHLLWIAFPHVIKEGEKVNFTIEYEGVIDERICYLDIPEELLIEQEKFMGIFNIGKRYAYQTEEYTLLTPESYWYPRPGVCYSNESPDWQQSYFTNFEMKVTPTPGLTALSQGKRSLSSDSLTTTFEPEYPLQSMSLIIGNYKSYSINVYDTDYAVWYLDGHDFFSKELNLIADTIPTIIEDVRYSYEDNVGMYYPFNRFSIIEVPAHFSSYQRTWTQAQEKMQPEMVLVTEKMYDNWRFDVKGQKKRRKESMGRGGFGGRGGRGGRGGQTMTEYDIQMGIMRDMLFFMWDVNAGADFRAGQMGRNTISMKPNPYYIFPQMYNFRYNIYSSEWPVANRMVELLLQGDTRGNSWMRDINGLSNDEKSLMLMQNYSFKELQNDVEHRDLIDNLIKLQGKRLFLNAERELGVLAFQDTLYNHVRANAFRNLSFEALLDTLGQIVGTDFNSLLEEWNKPAELTEFMIGTPSVNLIKTETQEIYQAEIVIANLSDKAGSVNMKIQFWSQGGNNDYQIFNGEEKPTEWIVDFNPHETKRIVTHWEETPGSFIINTLFSKNLPVQVMARNNNRIEEIYTLTEEGEYLLSEGFLNETDEIIVDNEDSILFTLSVPPPSGYLGEWINGNSEEKDFKYVGVNEWHAPARWTSTTDQSYYGHSIRSAMVIRSGKGDQYAEWKIPVPSAGKYELYYHARRPMQLRQGNRWGRQKYMYNFIVSSEADAYEDKVELNMRRINDGWNLLDTYGLTGDTLVVRLTDESELNMITADAVKLVRK